jgi:acyl-CoA synthetase (AMP-forming)/AMP-acid ligase II
MAETTLLVTGEAVQAEPKHLILKATDLQQNQVTLVAAADADAARPIVSCGPPAIANQVCIVDPDSHLPCPPNTIGEIWVRWSRSIAQGYWRREALPEKPSTPPWPMGLRAVFAHGRPGVSLRR